MEDEKAMFEKRILEKKTLIMKRITTKIEETDVFALFGEGSVEKVEIKPSMKTPGTYYAVIDFNSIDDAENAFETKCGEMINGSKYSLERYRDVTMFAKSRSSVRFRNLDERLDVNTMREICGQYGAILSCTRSGPDAFIEFQDISAANNCIKLNGNELGGKIYVVEKTYNKPLNQDNNISLFVDGLLNTDTERDLEIIFGKYGEVTCCKIKLNKLGKSTCRGFVSMSKLDSKTAVDALHKGTVEGRYLYVQPTGTYDNSYYENKCVSKTNLYVKGIEKGISDETFRKMFQKFGEIKAINLNKKNDISTGLGFVDFLNEDDAAKAIAAYHGKIIGKRKMVVCYFEYKPKRIVKSH